MKRYELAYSNPYGEHLREAENGEWVRFEDVEAIAAENERLRNLLASVKDALAGALDGGLAYANNAALTAISRELRHG